MGLFMDRPNIQQRRPIESDQRSRANDHFNSLGARADSPRAGERFGEGFLRRPMNDKGGAAVTGGSPLFMSSGAEGETRTPTEQPPLDPEPSASTSSATSAKSL